MTDRIRKFTERFHAENPWFRDHPGMDDRDDKGVPYWEEGHDRRRCDLVLDQDGHLVDATEHAAIPPGAVGPEGE